MQKTYHKIINGDCRQMSELKDESIHLVATSPPYWQLKDYGTENQIGFHDDYETYINHLNLTWQECYRVLHKGCRLCINIGDQFARSVYYGRYKIIPIHSEIIKFCETIGFDFMGSIIWQKATTMNTTGGASIMGSFPHPRNGIVKLDFEYILLFKKQGVAPKPTAEQKQLSVMTTEEWNTYFNGHWYFSGAKQEGGHIAMFPEELPKRLIKMFSFSGENVLDPFMGSGTTGLVAKNLGRNSCGYEINPDFIPIIKQKLGVNETQMFDEAIFDFVKQEIPDINLEQKIKELPYIFVDTHKLDKKIDVKKLQFGSKLDANGSEKKEEFFRVDRVISVDKLLLTNGLTIKLLGIKPYPECWKFRGEDVNWEAKKFIDEKVDKSNIFLKYDTEKYDAEGNLLCYVYLENKTFINAHILKKGFAKVDESLSYRMKTKFLSIWKDRSIIIAEEMKNYRMV
jgi:DNA modification methylase